MVAIHSIVAREILASGGTPTVEVELRLSDGSTGVASVPFGASAGAHEAAVVFDEDQRFGGKGMVKAVQAVNTDIASRCVGQSFSSLAQLDAQLRGVDGTPSLQRLGGNAILPVSIAYARAMAAASDQSLYAWLIAEYQTQDVVQSRLPYPMMVLIEGGKHADQSTDMQEYLIVPEGAPTVREAVRWGIEIMQALKSLLKKHGYSTNVGNEGAFAPDGIDSNERPLELLTQAIEHAGFTPGSEVWLAMDPAMSELYADGVYTLTREQRQLSSLEVITLWSQWLERYPLRSLEDGLAEDDWEHWPLLRQTLEAHHALCVGDDLTVTQLERVQKALESHSITALLVKPNQAGTVSDMMRAAMAMRERDLTCILSHRGGGETNDDALADMAIALGAKYVKVGPTRGERVAKYNRLLRIEDAQSMP